MVVYSDHGVVWYAMKTSHKKEMQAKAYLETYGVECFVPMMQDISTKTGRKKIILKPAVYNLIFVKVDLAQLKDIKISLNYLRNRLTTDGDISVPIIVPTQQMEQFIDAVTHNLDKIIYVDLTKVCIDKGTKVRITDGKFKGYEGELERIKGKRDRRVCVRVEGIVAYKFDVEAEFIEKI